MLIDLEAIQLKALKTTLNRCCFCRRHAGIEPGTPEFIRVGKELGEAFDAKYISLVSKQSAGFYPGIDDLFRK